MNEVEYERMQENAAMGAHILACVNAIISDNGAAWNEAHAEGSL